MPETCKNYILNCSSNCGSGSGSVSMSMSVAVAMPLAAHKFNKQGARAGQDTLSLLPGQLYVCCNEAYSLQSRDNVVVVAGCGQVRAASSSLKTKTKSIAGKLSCLPSNVGNINLANCLNTHTH